MQTKNWFFDVTLADGRIVRDVRVEAIDEDAAMDALYACDALPASGAFYYLRYRDALKRAKRLAIQIDSKIRIATGIDDRAPGRVEYAVIASCAVPKGFTVVAFANPTGSIESSGSRYHRMMARRSRDEEE